MTRAGWVRLLVIALSLGALEAACRVGWIDRFSLIPPSQMIATAAALLWSGKFAWDIALTFSTVALATVISMGAGLLLGYLLHRFPRFKRAADPFLASYYAVPAFIFYPVFIVFFGLNRWPLVAVAFTFAFVAMAISTVDGLNGVRPILYRTARSLRMSQAETLWRVALPASAPYLFTGIKLAVVYSFIGVVAGEFILSGAGLGYQIAFAYSAFETATMYGLMTILLVSVGTINMLLWSRERRLHARLNAR